MVIKTKYNVTNTLFRYCSGELKEYTVIKLTATVAGPDERTKIAYTLRTQNGNNIVVAEDDPTLHKNKNECLKLWAKEQGITIKILD